MYRPRGFRHVLRKFCAFHVERKVFAHAQIVWERDVVRIQKAVAIHSPVQPGELFTANDFVAAALALAQGFADDEVRLFRYSLLHGGDGVGEEKIVCIEEHKPIERRYRYSVTPRCAGAFVVVKFGIAEPWARVCGFLYDGFQLFVRPVDHDGSPEVLADLKIEALDGVANGVGTAVRRDDDVDGFCFHFPPPLRSLSYTYYVMCNRN